MTHIAPTLVRIKVDDAWILGTVRSCEVTPDGRTCTAVVSYGNLTHVKTARFEARQMQTVSGEPGCPVVHQDGTCRGLLTAANDLTRTAAMMLAERGIPRETVYVADQDSMARAANARGRHERALAAHPTAEGWRLEASHVALFLTAAGLLHDLHAGGLALSGGKPLFPAPGQYISAEPMAFLGLPDGEPGFRVVARGVEEMFGLESWLVREVARRIRSFSPQHPWSREAAEVR